MIKGVSSRNWDQLIRALYDGSVEVPASEFAGWAIGQVSADLHCSGVRWELEDVGGARLVQRSVGVVPPQSLDELRREPQPGHCIVSVPAEGSELLHVFGFFRERGGFTELDRLQLDRLGAFLPHVESLNQKLSLRPVAGITRADDMLSDNALGSAIVTVGGHVLSADDRFDAYLRSAHPDWDGLMLPFALDAGDESRQRPLIDSGLVAWAEPIGDHVQLRVRLDRRKSELSEREHDIALRVAKGLTFKEIGRQMNLAPSTISSHLYNLYHKLGIRRRAELVEWLSRRQGTFRQEETEEQRAQR